MRDALEMWPSAAKAACGAGFSGTAEQAAEKLASSAKSSPQALKREHIFNDLRHE